MEGLNLGALDYIHKPFVSALLLRRLEMHLSLLDYQKILENRNKTRDEVLSKLSREVGVSLNTVADMIKAAMETNNPGIIKDCLKKADNAIKPLLVLVNDSVIC
jgi:DNA-binding response OmpR family regulator